MEQPFDFPKILGKRNHLPGFLGTKAPPGAKIPNGFQEIGLPLGVPAHDQVHPRVKFQGLIPIIAELPQPQLR